MTVTGRALVGLGLLAPLAVACSRGRNAQPSDSAVGATAAAVAPNASPAAASVPDTVTRPSTSPTARPDSTTPTATPRPMPSETVLTGRVVAGGLAASPATSLQIEGGKPTTLLGSLEPELRRLGGATVWVSGAPAPNASFTVTRYEIVLMDGAKPAVGVVSARNGGVWLVGERDTVKLTTVPAELTAKQGAKVWVVGRRTGPELAVQTFGVIKDP